MDGHPRSNPFVYTHTNGHAHAPAQACTQPYPELHRRQARIYTHVCASSSTDSPRTERWGNLTR
jgi:hypothetical protein